MHGGDLSDTIVALATPQGVGALAIIRLSGNHAVQIANAAFYGKDLSQVESHTVHVGTIRDGETILDEVVVTIFKGPKSFTTEDIVEITCHGSMFIVKQVVMLLLRHGARLANPGEFTQRAFLNGQFDLTQAEAIADLIHSDSEASRKAAMDQMRGGFSKEIKQLREELIHFASMIELELDFSEEDVEFASRDELKSLINNLLVKISALIDSFEVGNVIKNGIPTVIAGKPNAGKSTLLNALLKEERAIVSEIAGTTRDVIEDEINLGGIAFRFIDTAGLRDTTDAIEALGVEKAHQKLSEAGLILFMFDLTGENRESIVAEIEWLENQPAPFIAIGNKADGVSEVRTKEFEELPHTLAMSANNSDDLTKLEEAILQKVNIDEIHTGSTVVTNLRHQQELVNTEHALQNVITGIEKGITNDILAMEIRQALHHLGEITGEITTDDLLETIFSKFCIGK
jgi:tRNA modification GTPase